VNEERIDEIAGKLFDEMFLAFKNDDDEVAHAKEDDFRERCLDLIAGGHPQSIAIAKWALSSSQLPFSRWCG